MREEMIVQFKDKKLIYEECSHGEALNHIHTLIIYLNKQATRYFRLKEVQEILING